MRKGHTLASMTYLVRVSGNAVGCRTRVEAIRLRRVLRVLEGRGPEGVREVDALKLRDLVERRAGVPADEIASEFSRRSKRRNA
jgi:hypothetical protein